MRPAHTAAALLLALVAAVRACTFGCTEGDVQTVLTDAWEILDVELFDMDSDRDLEVMVLFKQTVGASWFSFNGTGWAEAGVVRSSTTDVDSLLDSLSHLAIGHLNAGTIERRCVPVLTGRGWLTACACFAVRACLCASFGRTIRQSA